MSIYYVADKYKNYKYDESKAFKNDKGNLVVNAKCPCNRCNGTGIAISHVENGMPIPYIPDGGVCYQCNGAGSFSKTIRLYTEKEFTQLQKNKERAQQKREADLEAKMKAEYANNKKKWLEDNAFDSEGFTWVYKEEDSYDRKEELKSLGFRFNPNLLWHIATLPFGYEEYCIQIKLSDIATWSAWGKATFNPDAKEIVTKAIMATRPQVEDHSEWLGVVGDMIDNLQITCINTYTTEGIYGLSTCYTFEDEGGNVICWWTTSNPGIKKGQTGVIKGKIKALKEYKGQHQTQITRAKVVVDNF